MAKEYDATTKQLIESYPADWLAFAGLPVPAGVGPKVVDAELSSITAAADKLIRVGGAEPYLAHLELQSGADPSLDTRVLLYNVLARWRHRLPVRSVVVLLRPEAQSPRVSGRVLDVAAPDARLDFVYRLVRAWEQPVESLLAGGLGTLPMAPVCVRTEPELMSVFRQIEQRLRRDAAPAVARELKAAAYIVAGLLHPPDVIDRVVTGVREMEESATYQAILAKGKAQGKAEGKAEGTAEEARRIVLRLGRRRFGQPPAHVVTVLDALTDVPQLEGMIERVSEVAGWDDLLQAAG